jgi:hypothetical protein
MEDGFIILTLVILGFVFWAITMFTGDKVNDNDEVVEVSYKCPKCGGSDYFMSTRNVMKGIGGIYGNRGGMKKFPVCKVCDEIMDSN